METLNSRDFTRLKPNVYCGSTVNPDQLAIELFSNSVDSHVIGFGNIIEMKRCKNEYFYIRDYGTGIEISEPGEDGTTVLERAYSHLNTSGKFREDGEYGGTSLGAFGIGSKLVTYLSKWTQVKSVQNGKFEKITFNDGLFLSREYGETNESNGLATIFLPDKQFFDSIEMDQKALFKQFHDICCLCPKLIVKFEDEINNETKVISCPRGIEELLDDVQGNEIIKNRLNIRYEEGKKKFIMSLTYSDAYKSSIVPYVNYGYTESGTHITAVKNCITRELNKFAREKMWLKEEEKNLTGDQLQEGMYCVFNLIAPNIKYDAQVKSRVTSTDLAPFITESITNTLQLWLKENQNDAKKIIDKALLARKALEAARKARDKVRDKKGKTIIPVSNDKLSDCISKDAEECEIYIVEGKTK